MVWLGFLLKYILLFICHFQFPHYLFNSWLYRRFRLCGWLSFHLPIINSFISPNFSTIMTFKISTIGWLLSAFLLPISFSPAFSSTVPHAATIGQRWRRKWYQKNYDYFPRALPQFFSHSFKCWPFPL